MNKILQLFTLMKLKCEKNWRNFSIAKKLIKIFLSAFKTMIAIFDDGLQDFSFKAMIFQFYVLIQIQV